MITATLIWSSNLREKYQHYILVPFKNLLLTVCTLYILLISKHLERSCGFWGSCSEPGHLPTMGTPEKKTLSN